MKEVKLENDSGNNQSINQKEDDEYYESDSRAIIGGLEIDEEDTEDFITSASLNNNESENGSIESKERSKSTDSDLEETSSSIKVKHLDFLQKTLYFIHDYFLANLLLLLGFILYYLSLEGCNLSPDECIDLFVTKDLFTKLASKVFYAAVFFSLHIVLHIYWFKWRSANIVLTLLVFSDILLFIDNNYKASSHGGYNRIYLCYYLVIFSTVLLLVFEGIHSMRFFARTELVKVRRLVLLAVFVSSLVIAYFTVIENSCQNWETGFKGSRIDNSKACRIKPPDACYQDLLLYFLDASRVLEDNCFKQKGTRELFKPLLTNPNATHIGFPNTRNIPFSGIGSYDNFKSTVQRSLIDMDDPMAIKSGVEVSVKFKKINEDEVGEPIIKLEKLEGLEKERSKVFKELTSKEENTIMAKNFIFFFIDSVSRVHLRRVLPKTYTWLEKFYRSGNDSRYEAFQFLKYQAVGTWTTINMVPAFFGVGFEGHTKGEYFLKNYHDSGFVSASVGTMCSREVVDLETYNAAFTYYPFDHELYSFWCDPNFIRPDKSQATWYGPYSFRRKCLYGKPAVEWALDYSKQFFNEYKNSSKFFRIDIIDNHEGTGVAVGYNDDLIFDFLNDLENNGFLKDTVFLAVSDHNFNREGPYDTYQFKDWKHELTLPHLSLILDKQMKNFEKIRENLIHNENIMVTPYDLHASLLSFIDPKLVKTQKGQSFFHTKFLDDYKKRNCGMAEIQKAKKWCRCSEEYGGILS